MSDPLYDRLDRMQVNSGYDSDEPAMTDFVEDTPMSDTSKPARLEDLPFHLLEAMLQIATEKVDTDHDTVWLPLYEMGLVSYDESADDSAEWFDTITERGAVLVADYQQRRNPVYQDDGREILPASTERQQERVAYPPYSFQWNWLSDDDKWTLLKDESARREVLEAELATLRSELVAAKAENKALIVERDEQQKALHYGFLSLAAFLDYDTPTIPSAAWNTRHYMPFDALEKMRKFSE